MVIGQIPKGKVATYGQIAKLAGLPRNARQVGRILKDCTDAVPWHRVVNSKGEISQRGNIEGEISQREALEAEKIQFDANGRVLMKQYRWSLDQDDG